MATASVMLRSRSGLAFGVKGLGCLGFKVGLGRFGFRVKGSGCQGVREGLVANSSFSALQFAGRTHLRVSVLARNGVYDTGGYRLGVLLARGVLLCGGLPGPLFSETPKSTSQGPKPQTLS